ncbi:MAG: kelch-like protein [Chloroflexi bacterium]|nr:kelch-like protein [Chloroflexota bacterium]
MRHLSRHTRVERLVRECLMLAAALATGLLTTGLLPAAVQAQSASPWGERAPMLLPRSEASVAELNGKVYFLGGYPGARITSDSVQVYDTKTDTWELGPPLPVPLHHTMASVVNDRLYIIGGEGGNPTPGESVFQNGVYMLDEQAGQWIARAPMPTARSGGGSAVIDGKIYVAGGRPPRGHDLAVYDPASDTWTELPNIPTQRNHLGVVAVNGKLYVAGGRFGGGVGSEMTDRLEIYDPATNSWSEGAPLLAPRAGVTSVEANGCVYLIGGEGNDAHPMGVFDRAELYDPATNSWHSLPPLPTAMHGITGAAFLDGLIYVPGGATRRGVSGQDVTLKLQTLTVERSCG